MSHAEEQLLIEYKCPNCAHEWNDTWTSAVDAECPHCGLKNITPVSFRELKNIPKCPGCGSLEVSSNSPFTTYSCGSKDYDQRPGTFRQGPNCS